MEASGTAPPAAFPRQEGALAPYLKAIRAHRVVVILVTLAAIGAAVAWQVVRSPSYQATAEILLTPVPQDDTTFLGLQILRESNDPTRTAQTAASLIHSPQAAVLTATRMGGRYDRLRVEETVKVEPKGQSNILAVVATAHGAGEAARLANTYATSALAARRRVLTTQINQAVTRLRASPSSDDRDRARQLQALQGGQDPTLSISQSATPPEGPTGAPRWAIVLLAAIAGFTVASGAALLLEQINRRVRDLEELIELYPLPILGRVPEVQSRQRRAMLHDPLAVPPSVREVYRTLQVQLEQRSVGGRVIMVTSATTGDGKTMSSVNLAQALVATGQTVMLMDFDLRKPDVSGRLGVPGADGILSLASDERDLADIVVRAPQLPALRVAAAGASEASVPMLPILFRRLPAIMEEARLLAHYVVIDTAPLGEVSDALQLLPFVDDVVVVARTGNTSRTNFELMRDLLERSDHRPAGMLVIGSTGRQTASYYTYGYPQPAPSGVRRWFARSPSR